ncbi:MAG TPA: MCE family protein [Jatrophihabitans sp.]|jgi:virulence factor Mce-like protein
MLRRRGLGLVFILLIAGLLVLSVAIYNKAFTKVADVTLYTDHTGNQLQKSSDVKVRGVIVGSVKNVHSDGDGAKVTLALKPSEVQFIPKNVSARVLPKTLFGEQYVALQIPATHASAIKAGDVIQQDRSQGALETQDVLGDLLPLLQAVDPAELNATLTAIAGTLRGHGTQLGTLLVSLDSYLKQLNAAGPGGPMYTQRIVDDVAKLGKVADEYNDAAPDILATLDNLKTTVHTVSTSKKQLDTLLRTVSSTSATTKAVLAENERALTSVANSSAQTFGLLGEFAPEYQCVFEAMSDVENLAKNYVRDGAMQLSIVLDNTNMGPYKPGEEPKLIGGQGPNCFGLPDDPQPRNNGHSAMPSQWVCLNDGAWFVDSCPAEKTGTTSAGTSKTGSGK